MVDLLFIVVFAPTLTGTASSQLVPQQIAKRRRLAAPSGVRSPHVVRAAEDENVVDGDVGDEAESISSETSARVVTKSRTRGIETGGRAGYEKHIKNIDYWVRVKNYENARNIFEQHVDLKTMIPAVWLLVRENSCDR